FESGTVRSRWFDEMYDDFGAPHAHCSAYAAWLDSKPLDYMLQKQTEADTLYTRLGITFAIGDESGVERSIPFDILPRIVRPEAWKILSEGSCQRVRALNAFLKDIYHDREIIRAGIIPERHVLGNKLYREGMCGIKVPSDVYVHVAGIDVVKVARDKFY